MCFYMFLLAFWETQLFLQVSALALLWRCSGFALALLWLCSGAALALLWL